MALAGDGDDGDGNDNDEIVRMLLPADFGGNGD